MITMMIWLLLLYHLPVWLGTNARLLCSVLSGRVDPIPIHVEEKQLGFGRMQMEVCIKSVLPTSTQISLVVSVLHKGSRIYLVFSVLRRKIII